MGLENLKGIVELGNIDIKCVIFRIKDNNDRGRNQGRIDEDHL